MGGDYLTDTYTTEETCEGERPGAHARFDIQEKAVSNEEKYSHYGGVLYFHT